ncbi:hypothetical protein [Pseudomonas aeruginosa]|uniref:hypothetical protein n=1 Tax=Pseudomonas aeruginosa TaxID=287 RepID=UPI0011BFC7E3|nr:hypothetical protein [Pseudomonas aeruginosa]
MANGQSDIVAQYGMSRGWRVLPRTVLVEGTSDVALFELAAHHFLKQSGKAILADLAIVAAGEGDQGGTRGVVRELMVLRSLATAFLSPAGRPIYRAIGLFDNDTAGRRAVKGAHDIDVSIIEYRDVFRLRPAMPRTGSIDPAALQRSFEKQNEAYKSLDWELEDLVGEQLMSLFLEEHPTALLRDYKASDAVHREFTRDGKSQLVRFCKSYADLTNLQRLIDVLHALRHYLNLPSLQ